MDAENDAAGSAGIQLNNGSRTGWRGVNVGGDHEAGAGSQGHLRVRRMNDPGKDAECKRGDDERDEARARDRSQVP